MILFACIPPDYGKMPKVLFNSDGDWKRNFEINKETYTMKISGICAPKKGLEIKFHIEIENKAENEMSISEDIIRMLCDEFRIVSLYNASENSNDYWLNIESTERYKAISERIDKNNAEIYCSFIIENTDISSILIEFRLEKNGGVW
jgi:hypothetical protein